MENPAIAQLLTNQERSKISRQSTNLPLFVKKKKNSCNLSHHLSASPEEDGDGLGVLALLYHQHFVHGGTEVHFPHKTSRAQLVSAQFLKAGHNTAAGGDSNQLERDEEFVTSLQYFTRSFLKLLVFFIALSIVRKNMFLLSLSIQLDGKNIHYILKL